MKMYRDLAKRSFAHINRFTIILTALCAAYLAIFLPGIFSKAYVHPFGVILCFFAGPTSLYGICRMLYAILGGYQKRVRSYIKAAPDPAFTQSQLEQAYAAARHDNYLCIAGAWVFVQKGPETYLYETQELLWVYQHKSAVWEASTRQIKDYRYYLAIALTSGALALFEMPEEAAAGSLILFKENTSGIAVGYSDERSALFQKSTQQFAQEVCGRAL